MLYQLARMYGVQTSYYDVTHSRRRASVDALLAVLRSVGAPVATLQDVPSALREYQQARWQQPLEPVTVAWENRVPLVEVRLPSATADATLTAHLTLETGEQQSLTWHGADLPVMGAAEVEGRRYVIKRLRLPGRLPWGYHRFALDAPEDAPGKPVETLVMVAPRRVYGFQEGSKSVAWGVFLPLYALYTHRSWGSGDLSDLETLIAWVSQSGGSVVATLPLLATFPEEPSPYAPVSRLLWNEFYLDISRVAELPKCPPAQATVQSEAFRREIEALRELPLVEYGREMSLKRRVLEQLARCCFAEDSDRLEALRRFAEAHPVVEDYALFRATCEKQGVSWHSWPELLRDGVLKEGDYNEEAKRYHLYVQWLAQEQIGAVCQKAQEKGVSLYLDLPLGVHPDGYDVWRYRKVFARDASGGAPPDDFFIKGQDWGFPPLHPAGLRQQGYRYYIDCLRHQLRHAGILRIDHAMSFHRLFWVPKGFKASEGVYVRYAAQELYAILCLESHRHKCCIVGENLGTVPSYINRALRQHSIHGMHVMQFALTPEARRGPGTVPADYVASLNTHDTPTFAGFWQGLDIEDRVRLGLLDDASARHEMDRRRATREAVIAFLRDAGFVTGLSADPKAVLRGLLAFLSGNPAKLVLINLEDLWLESEPQNVPGTTTERPNWRRKCDYAFETLSQLPEVTELLHEVNRIRKERGGYGMLEKGDKAITRASEVKAEVQSVCYDVSLLTDQDLFLFNEGTHLRLYEKLGAHLLTAKGVPGTYFAVWAPDARQVYVIGSFNGWDKTSYPLRPRDRSGIWEGFVPGLGNEAVYKYHVVSRYRGYQADKADPFAFHNETPPKTASIVWDLEYAWGDQEWMLKRRQRNALDAPIAIYEVHLGSWMRLPEEGDRFLSYRELAPKLAEHVQRLGFTHVELLPVMEHPFYGSWGYQTTGYFAPTSRYGRPQDFMYFVDYLHQHGIGVILDWVPSHFPSDEHGLGFFDGTHLYEHGDPRKGFHPDWNSFIFNYGRNEVRSFLLSSALFWLEKYHADGLRVDAVASMLYLDYSRKEGEWIPNQYGGRENLEAIAFLRHFNEEVYKQYPGVQTMAEESTAWPMVSRPTYVGGLGFGLKWDMGWMHDTLVYMTKAPVFRKYHQNELTFRMIYAFFENFVLPLSHDEVVHGKGSLLGKMPGDNPQKFANLRLLLGYMYAQPAKKLLFMGGEFGQWREWFHDESLDWHLLQYQPHVGLQKWVQDLNRLYKSEPALHELDCDAAGFEWVDCSDADSSVLSLIRKGRSRGDIFLVVGNFTPVPRFHYRVGAPRPGLWKEILNSDAREYGGGGLGNLGRVEAVSNAHHGHSYSLDLTLPPLAIVFFKSEAKEP
jgi:alpha-1,4-glucan:alpha-1,4-glucan 6-glycosyltransferase/4-alpha-glucanotransferase